MSLKKPKNPAISLAHIYIVENAFGLVKIGVAADPDKRIRMIETVCGAPVTRQYISSPCLMHRELESALHQHFSTRRNTGNWFNILFEDAVLVLKVFQKKHTRTSAPAVFNFEGYLIRVIMHNGEPWFSARDVCECLDFSHCIDAVCRLNAHEKLIKLLEDSQGRRLREQGNEVYDPESFPPQTFVNEAGLYRLIFLSGQPQAGRFQAWVRRLSLQRPVVYNGVRRRLPTASKTHLLTQHPAQKQPSPDGLAIVKLFIEQCCQIEPQARTGTRRLYSAYRKWAVLKYGRPLMPLDRFGLALSKLGYEKVKRNKEIFRRGLTIKADNSHGFS